MIAGTCAYHPTPFGLSLSFDKLRMIGNFEYHPTPFGLSLSKPCSARALRQAQCERGGGLMEKADAV